MSSTQVDARVDAAHAGPPGQAGHGPVHVKHRWSALGVIGLAQLMVVLDATIVNIALPSAQSALHFNNGDRQWIVTAYSLAFGSLLLLGGRLADLFGRKTTFIVGVIGFAGASALGGAADSFTMLVVARTVQGSFGALLAPAALSLLTTTFTDTKERARAFGIYGAIAGSGAAIGLILGGVLTEYLNWRWTLYVNDIIAVLALIGAIIFLKRSVPAQRPRLDLLGVILVSAGLFGIVYGFANADTHPWRSWMVWGFLAGAGVLLILFFVWQSLAKHPLLPLRVLADRNRGGAFATVLISSAGMFGVFLFLTYYLQSTMGYSPVKNGVAFLPMVGALIVMAQLSLNLLIPKIGPKIIVPLGLAIACGGMVWLTRLGLHTSYTSAVLPPLLLLGAGLGLAMPAAMSFATLGVQMSDQGVASATVNTTQQVGGSISTALLNTLATTAAAHYVTSHQTDPLVRQHAALHSYATAYWWSAGFFAFAVVVTLLLFRSRKANAANAARAAAALPVNPEGIPAQAGPAAMAARPQVAAATPAIRGRVLDGAGAPVARAAITVIDAGGRQVARATAREDGSYGVETSERGNFVLVGSAPGHQPQVATLAMGSTPVTHDLVLAGTGGLLGTVRDRVGMPLAGALVVATNARGEVAGSATTGSDGDYKLADLVPGSYTIAVNAPGHRPTAELASVAGEGTRFDIELLGAARVRGTIRGQDGRPVEDARVTLLDAAGSVIAAKVTGADGEYTFADLSGDEYTVIASGYAPVATPVSVNGSGADGLDVFLGHEGVKEAV